SEKANAYLLNEGVMRSIVEKDSKMIKPAESWIQPIF
ncbi:MAG: hypothetical protein H6Q26_3414, partial [Bacteroidetes bacterium]|nr:hypothetical protein [Bacteroidota bacterium]